MSFMNRSIKYEYDSAENIINNIATSAMIYLCSQNRSASGWAWIWTGLWFSFIGHSIYLTGEKKRQTKMSRKRKKFHFQRNQSKHALTAIFSLLSLSVSFSCSRSASLTQPHIFVSKPFSLAHTFPHNFIDEWVLGIFSKSLKTFN